MSRPESKSLARRVRYLIDSSLFIPIVICCWTLRFRNKAKTRCRVFGSLPSKLKLKHVCSWEHIDKAR